MEAPVGEDIRSLPLPKRGVLCLFVAEDPENTVFWRDAGYIRAIYTPPTTALRPLKRPKGHPRGKPRTLVFTQTFDIPFDRYQVET
jgi:hypothetical protein